jgi:hypothetical protein
MQPDMEPGKSGEANDRARPRPLGGWSPLRVAQLIFFTVVVFFGIFLGGAAIHSLFAHRYERALLYAVAAVALYRGSRWFLESRFPRT